MRKLLALIALVYLSGTVALAGGEQQPPAPPVAKVTLCDISISLVVPEGYQKGMESTVEDVVVWLNRNKRHGKHFPILQIGTKKFHSKAIQGVPLEKLAEVLLEGKGSTWKDWRHAEIQTVQLNGRTYAKARFSGTKDQYEVPVKGFQYVTLIGDTLVMVIAQDSDPEQLNLKELEAALSTLKIDG